MSKVVRGNIDAEQIAGACRQGDASVIQMYNASPALKTGVLLYDANGDAMSLALPNDATKFLDGTGEWSTPGGGGGGGTGMGTAFTAPPTTGWTNVNFQAGTSLTTSSVSANLHIADNASLNWQLITRSVSGDFDLVVFLRSFQFDVNSQASGLYITDGTKLMGIEYLTQNASNQWRVEKITNVTTDSGTAASLTNLVYGGPCHGGTWMRIVRSSGTLYFYIGLDGATWKQLFSESVGTFITPTGVGFGGVSVAGSASLFVEACALSWSGVP